MGINTAMPVAFIGHGSPMNVITDNQYRRSWQEIGQRFAPHGAIVKPRLILCISAHWQTHGTYITAMDAPRTIHDFSGFPSQLYTQHYAAPGDSQAARNIEGILKQAGFTVTPTLEWGLDHGAWSVLLPMFAQADIPVLQLSLDADKTYAQHYALGRSLAQLATTGVFLLGSGNIVHNLSAFFNNADNVLGRVFDHGIADVISQRGDMVHFLQKAENAAAYRFAVPTDEHFLPLLYCYAATDALHQLPQFFNDDVAMAQKGISMRSVWWQ